MTDGAVMMKTIHRTTTKQEQPNMWCANDLMLLLGVYRKRMRDLVIPGLRPNASANLESSIALRKLGLIEQVSGWWRTTPKGDKLVEILLEAKPTQE